MGDTASDCKREHQRDQIPRSTLPGQANETQPAREHNPLHWSPFLSFGDGQPVAPNDKKRCGDPDRESGVNNDC
jgi:hypothetical protein